MEWMFILSNSDPSSIFRDPINFKFDNGVASSSNKELPAPSATKKIENLFNLPGWERRNKGTKAYWLCRSCGNDLAQEVHNLIFRQALAEATADHRD